MCLSLPIKAVFPTFAAMKRMVWIGIVVLLVVAACNRPDNNLVETRRTMPLPTTIASPELACIDSLMWRQPDSALACLIPYFDTCCRDAKFCVSTTTTFNRHYANLLLSELLYKNDYAQTNRPTLLQAVHYFNSLVREAPPFKGAGGIKKDHSQNPNLVFLDARAHYIYGVGYYENDSVVEACKEYMKAFEIIENHFKDKDLINHKAQFMALTYTRLSMLFSDMYLHEQAIYFAQLSLASNQKLDVPRWHIARMLCEIGIHYDIMNQLDSADYYYKNAVIVLNDTNSLLYRDIYTRQIILSYKKGLEENSLSQLHYIMSQSNSKMEYLSRYLTIGEVFYYEKQLDSAWFYLDKVYNTTESIASKKQAAEWLIDIGKAQNRKEDYKYADFLAPFANQEENQGEVKSHLTELYNAFRQANLSRQHRQIVKKYMTIGLVVLVGLLVGLLAYVFLYHKNKRRKQLLEKQIKEEQLSHDMKQKALSGRLKQSNQKLQETLKRIEYQEALHKTTENNTTYYAFDERYEAFRQSQICIEVFDAVNNLHDNIRNTLKTNADVTGYKAFALSLLQTAQLTKTVEMFFPNLYTALKTHYAALDRKKWLHCCLYLLQLDKMSICVLLQEPYYSCRRCILKLEEAFDCRQGLSAFIIEQAKAC